MRRGHKKTACALLMLALAWSQARVAAQLPEPNCNSNRYEGNEVWSGVANFIGSGGGQFWWGIKASPFAQPVSWLDMCAKRLEVCQADAAVPGSMTGFKPTCVCDMWSCLHRQPALEVDARPTCHFTRPQLLSFYCSAARYINATCSDPAYVSLPPGDACPSTPSEGFTFDDIPGDGIRIPNGYQGLSWDNWFMVDGDNYQVQNGYYAGVISSPKVAFNGYGYPGTIQAPEGGLLTLHSLFLTSAWDEDNIVTITASDERGAPVGTFVTSLATDNPRLVNFDAMGPPGGVSRLPDGLVTGTFAGVKSITISTSATQVALDNLHVSTQAEPGREIVPLPTQALEFWRAPPGASAPIRKPHKASPQGGTTDSAAGQRAGSVSASAGI